LTEHAFDVGKDGRVMNQTAEATDKREPILPEAQASAAAVTNTVEPTSSPEPAVLKTDRQAEPGAPASSAATHQVESASPQATTPEVSVASSPVTASPEIDAVQQADPSPENASSASPTADLAVPETSGHEEEQANEPNRNDSSPAKPGSGSGAMDSADSPDSPDSPESATKEAEGAKKARAPRMPKTPSKPVEAGGSITTIVERVVRMTTLSDEHAAALGRLFNVSLPEDYVARLTRLTGASLGPIGNGAAEALTIVLGLESANPIHVGVQLGRLAATSLPDVYRCAHALTGETAVALPKGDNAVFAVADVLATLTGEDFALARALSAALE
jgi:hypothetical protein